MLGRSHPLKPAVFHILMALAAGDRHGLGIADEVEAMTDGVVQLPPGTLYRCLKEMAAAGLIREVRRQAGEDPRRRFYSLAPPGRAVLEAEVARIDRLARLARKRGVRPAQAHS
jgi:DNA-binding PadR family transcriptional regulator